MTKEIAESSFLLFDLNMSIINASLAYDPSLCERLDVLCDSYPYQLSTVYSSPTYNQVRASTPSSSRQRMIADKTDKRPTTSPFFLRTIAEHIKQEGFRKNQERMCSTHETWADCRQKEFSRHMNSWRRGIVGYRGHCPLWAREQYFFEHPREVSKQNKIYVPCQVKRYNTVTQPAYYE